MKVIILAGGKATRLPQSAKNIPKSLIKVGKKTILQHQIDLLKKHGLTDIRLSLGYRANEIINYLNGKYEYIIEPEPLGTGGAIKFASKGLKDDFMVLNGDVLSDINLSEFIKFHKKNKLFGTIAAWHCEDCCDYGMIEVKGEKITKFLEKPTNKCAGYINAGFYILSPKIFKSIKKTSFSIENDVFPELAKNHQLSAYIYKGYWTDLGTEKRLEEAKRRFGAM